MELIRVAEGKAVSKRDFRLLRGKSHRSIMRNNLLESIAQANGGGSVVSETNEDGVLRVKLLVKKQDLKQMVELMRSGKSIIGHQSSQSLSLSLEQRLNLLRRKQLCRANAVKAASRGHGSWTPALQSIPEEI